MHSCPCRASALVLHGTAAATTGAKMPQHPLQTLVYTPALLALAPLHAPTCLFTQMTRRSLGSDSLNPACNMELIKQH
jgi:hypothetical protein